MRKVENSKILITGAAGFIGSNLVDFFVEKGFEVVGLDNFLTGKRENIEEFIEKDNFSFIEADIRNREKLNTIFDENNVNYILHQAARGSVPKSVEDPILTNDMNINGTLNLLWCSHQHNVEKLVCAISSSIYGDTGESAEKETQRYKPKSPYAVTKVTKDLYYKVFNDIYDINTVGLRYFNVYGPKQDPSGDYAAVIPKFITNALNNDPLVIYGDGKQTRDFTFIEDVVQANYLALKEEGANGESFNISFGDNITIKKLAESIIELTNSDSEIVFDDPRPGDVRDSLGNTSKAKEILNYNSDYSLEKGLKKTISWYKHNER